MNNARPAEPFEINALADIWFESWGEAHKDHVPAELIALRTRESFRTRLLNRLQDTICAGPPGAPIGFCMLKENELFQMYVAPEGRGKRVASDLMKAALNLMKEQGFKQATLAVIPQNHRAMAFYEKNGWVRGELKTIELETLSAPFKLPCLIYHRDL